VPGSDAVQPTLLSAPTCTSLVVSLKENNRAFGTPGKVDDIAEYITAQHWCWVAVRKSDSVRSLEG